MSDLVPWLLQAGYVDDEVENAVVLHKELDSGARVTVRRDEEQWCVASFAPRKDESTISFVLSGVPNDELQGKLEQYESELSWLYETFNGK